MDRIYLHSGSSYRADGYAAYYRREVNRWWILPNSCRLLSCQVSSSPSSFYMLNNSGLTQFGHTVYISYSTSGHGEQFPETFQTPTGKLTEALSGLHSLPR